MRSTAYFQQANAIFSVLQSIKQDQMDILIELRDTDLKILLALHISQQTIEEEVDQRDDEDN